MIKEIKKLQAFRKWFDKFVKRNYGKKCPDFVWNCACCHAHFVKDVFGNFADDLIDTENWIERQMRKKKQIRTKRKKSVTQTKVDY